jgi:DNA-binding transcriptional MerR regulator
MSLKQIKEIIKEYDPATITADEINGLKIMLQHETFSKVHEDIINKIKEIDAYIKKEQKILKRIKKAKNKVKNSYPKKDELGEPVIVFTFTVDPIIPLEPKDKKDKP